MTRKRLDEVATVTRQMSTLLGAGIPLTETLRAIIEQAQSRELSMTFRDIREKVSQGSTFGDALAFHPQYFNDLYVNMVKAGEAAGNLDVILGRLADFVQAQRKLRDKVSAAMTYPIVMVCVAVLVISILMTVVVPKITQSLITQKKTIPLPTQILIGLSSFFQTYWWVLLLGIALLTVVIQWVYRTSRGRMAIDKFLLKVPVFGDLLRKQAIARFSTTFSTLLKSGVPVVQCLEISGRIVNNRVLQAVIDDVRHKIVEGADIATPIKRSGRSPGRGLYDRRRRAVGAAGADPGPDLRDLRRGDRSRDPAGDGAPGAPADRRHGRDCRIHHLFDHSADPSDRRRQRRVGAPAAPGSIGNFVVVRSVGTSFALADPPRSYHAHSSDSRPLREEIAQGNRLTRHFSEVHRNKS